MANVTITREEAEEDLLPNVCASTGRPTRERKWKVFGWSPRWVWLFVFTLPPVGIILWACLQRRMEVYLPLVVEKHTHWAWRLLLFIPAGLCGGCLLSQVVVRLAVRAAELQPEDYALLLTLAVVGLVICATGLIPWFLSIRPTCLTTTHIVLANVQQRFAAAVREGRERRARGEVAREDRQRNRRRVRVAYPVGTLPDAPQGDYPLPPPPPKPKDDQEPWW